MKKALKVILILLLAVLVGFVAIRLIQTMRAVSAGQIPAATASAAPVAPEQSAADTQPEQPTGGAASVPKADSEAEVTAEAAAQHAFEPAADMPEQSAGISASGSAGEVDTGAESAAAPAQSYDLNFTVGGQTISAGTETLDLTQASSEEIDRLIAVLPALTKLHTMELGSAAAESPAISWEQVRAMREAAPNTVLNYRFTVQGYPFTLADEILNLNHITFTDEGELAGKIAACMPNLTLLDMDSCGVSNESMAAIRDSLPDSVTVAWRIWFGKDYTIRTDEVRVLASNPDRGGNLTEDQIQGLYYCTKVKYLDLGHNDMLSSIEFVRNMPDLEVLIIGMTRVRDLSPLTECPKLNYLEYQTSAASDLSPLAELSNLKDLNLCYDFALRDIRPLYGLDLDRLWIGCYDPIPIEQIEEYRRLHPNCIINTTTENPTGEEWRTLKDYYPPRPAPRYEQLWDEFQYGREFQAYAYIGNDSRENSRFEYY